MDQIDRQVNITAGFVGQVAAEIAGRAKRFSHLIIGRELSPGLCSQGPSGRLRVATSAVSRPHAFATASPAANADPLEYYLAL
jgi:hypothetical protein